MKALAALVLSAALICTPLSVEARVIMIRHFDNRDLCLVTHDLEDGSKFKVAECDDLYQARMKLWVVSGSAGTKEEIEYSQLRPYYDQSLCIEAKAEMGESLKLRECGRSDRARKRQEWGLRCCGHPIVPKMAMKEECDCDCADCSSLIASHSKRYFNDPKPGDKIRLTGNTALEWLIEEVDKDDIEEISISADENLNDNACRMFVLEEPGDGPHKFCIYPKGGQSKLRNEIMIDRCLPRYKEDQNWCFDKDFRIHDSNNNDLCWQASCVDEGCKIKLKPCSGSKKQKWIHLAFREKWTEADNYMSECTEPICLREGCEPQCRRRLCLTPVGFPRENLNGRLKLEYDDRAQWLQRSGLDE